MLDWDGFRYFLALHRRRTLKAAAEQLQVDQTTVGRRISVLESTLDAKLFEKRSDGYFLTVAGKRVLSTVEATENSLLSVERVIVGQEERIEGVVRVAMPGALANHWLIPRLAPLLRKWPRLELEFLTGPEVINLARREADLALRLVRPTQQDIVARKVGKLELALYAHPRLWQVGKRPARKEDLETIPFVGLFADSISEPEALLIKRLEPHLRYAIRSAAWSSVFYAVQAGLGVGILPTFVALKDPELIRLGIVAPISTPLWLVVHPDIVHSARVRAVIDHILSLFN